MQKYTILTIMQNKFAISCHQLGLSLFIFRDIPIDIMFNFLIFAKSV